MKSVFEEIDYPMFEHYFSQALPIACFRADDLLVRMAWASDRNEVIYLEVIDTSALPAEHQRLCRCITCAEAAAIAALFIADESPLTAAAYQVLESTFAGVPNHLRPIP